MHVYYKESYTPYLRLHTIKSVFSVAEEKIVAGVTDRLGGIRFSY